MTAWLISQAWPYLIGLMALLGVRRAVAVTSLTPKPVADSPAPQTAAKPSFLARLWALLTGKGA